MRSEEGLSLQFVNSLASLVADIAARGTRATCGDRRAVGEA
jgi:hypothetical protein